MSENIGQIDVENGEEGLPIPFMREMQQSQLMMKNHIDCILLLFILLLII